ncbi:MAG TPA: MarR family transcriptional regulator [Candidatus Limnocylindrales bacterium]
MTTAAAAGLVEQILDQLEPLISRQRKAIAQQGCFRTISSTQRHVLLLLDSDGPMTMSRIAELLDVSLPNVTGIVERMVDHGLVARIRSDDDRRIVSVAVTDVGRQTVEEIDLVRRSQLAAVICRLNAEQQQRALRTFTDLRQAAELLQLEETSTTHAQGEAL